MDSTIVVGVAVIVGVVFVVGAGAVLCTRRKANASNTTNTALDSIPTPETRGTTPLPSSDYNPINVHNHSQYQPPTNSNLNSSSSSRNPYAQHLSSNAKAYSSKTGSEFFSELLPFRLDESEVLLTRKLSTGAFGVVWLGHYRGHPVAVKRMIEGSTDDRMGFSREIRTMANLSHPTIVQFLGCTWTKATDLSAITEYMDGGDVRSLLENRKIDLTWKKEKVSIAIDIADALSYMHSLEPRIIHRDLKSRNVLLNSAMVAKLSDFGLSRNRTYEETLTAGVGTVRWTAPEVMLGDNYSEQADVYSFGVVLSELDTREIPFEEKSTGRSGNAPSQPDMAIVIKVAKGELRPQFSADCPVVIDKIAKACLQFDPKLRPTAQAVLRMLQDAKMQLLQT